jgi:hypothetical protein
MKEDEYVELPQQNQQMQAVMKGMRQMFGPEYQNEDEMAEFLRWKQQRNFVQGSRRRNDLEDDAPLEGAETFKATRSMFSGKMKSKLDFYKILSNEGQIYLPPIDECPVTFLKDLVMGRKKCFSNSDISVINVPYFEELAAKNLFDEIKRVPAFLLYLPDFNAGQRPPNRKYMYNVRSLRLFSCGPPVDCQHCRPYLLPPEHPGRLPPAQGALREPGQ